MLTVCNSHCACSFFTGCCRDLPQLLFLFSRRILPPSSLRRGSQIMVFAKGWFPFEAPRALFPKIWLWGCWLCKSRSSEQMEVVERASIPGLYKKRRAQPALDNCANMLLNPSRSKGLTRWERAMFLRRRLEPRWQWKSFLDLFFFLSSGS